MTSLQHMLLKTGGRLLKHPCLYWLLLAESHLTRRLFRAMLGRIAALPLPAAWARWRPGRTSSDEQAKDGEVWQEFVERAKFVLCDSQNW